MEWNGVLKGMGNRKEREDMWTLMGIKDTGPFIWANEMNQAQLFALSPSKTFECSRGKQVDFPGVGKRQWHISEVTFPDYIVP